MVFQWFSPHFRQIRPLGDLKGAAHSIHADDMQAIGYVRVSTDRQAEQAFRWKRKSPVMSPVGYVTYSGQKPL